MSSQILCVYSNCCVGFIGFLNVGFFGDYLLTLDLPSNEQQHVQLQKHFCSPALEILYSSNLSTGIFIRLKDNTEVKSKSSGS